MKVAQKVAQALFETAAQTVEYQKHARGQKSRESFGVFRFP
jgi:hypothetical protein